MHVIMQVPTSSSLDHEILRKIFERLRSWSFEPDVHTILPLLAQVYEDLLRRDYSRWEVLDTICELLFLIEDMADSGENCNTTYPFTWLSYYLNIFLYSSQKSLDISRILTLTRHKSYQAN